MSNIIAMPPTMLKLGVVQFFSWFAFFTMWSMSTSALTEFVFNSPKPDASLMSADAYTAADLAYNNAADLVGAAMGMYGLSSMVFALILTFITSKFNINRKFTHMICLIIGGLGFMFMLKTGNQGQLNLCFACIGIAWGSILSMPYAIFYMPYSMLSSSVEPKKNGLIHGAF